MRGQAATEHQIAAIAERQAGMVAYDQLRTLGLSAAAIQRRADAGLLHRRHRGVYAVGHRLLARDGLFWAAVLACRPDGVVSHRSAADAWEIMRTSSRIVHITVGSGGRNRRQGIRLHHVPALPDDEVTTLRGLPITTPARTLLDVSRQLHPRQLEAALDRAEQLRLLSFDDLHALLARYPRRRGTRSLKAQLERYRGPIDARSELERLVYKLCDEHGLPLPLVNVSIEGRVRDFYWPDCRLVVEVDGYTWHRSPSAFNDDRARDVELTLGGYRVLRFTYEQVKYQPEYVIRALVLALRMR